MQLPQLPSLNRPEVRAMSSRNSKFPTELTGQHKEAVLGFRYQPEKIENGKKISALFSARVKILSSDAENAVGRIYSIAFWMGGDYPEYGDRDRLAFIAACVGQKPDDPDFDGDAAQQMLVDQDEAGGFETEECVIFHTRTTRSKDKAEIKDGKPVLVTKTYPSDYFAEVS
jgi:hypothetical protein